MKLTDDMIALFEQEQIKYGTRVALHNILFVYLQTQLKELTGKDIKITVKG